LPDRLALLVMHERRLSAKPDAVRLGAGAALASARADQVALELGKGRLEQST